MAYPVQGFHPEDGRISLQRVRGLFGTMPDSASDSPALVQSPIVLSNGQPEWRQTPCFPDPSKACVPAQVTGTQPILSLSCEEQASLQRHDDGHADAPSLDP